MKRLILSILLAGAFTASLLADTTPAFPGGMEAFFSFLNKNMQYPTRAADNGIEGKVVVQFDVDEHGTISNARILRPVDPDLEEEALRIVHAMPKWIPATDNAGHPIASNAVIPITFKLSE